MTLSTSSSTPSTASSTPSTISTRKQWFARNRFLLWQGQTLSRLGDQAFLIAEMMLIGRATNSSLALGIVLLSSFVPPLLLMPFAGALADRGSRRRILIASDLAAAVTLIFASLLIASNTSLVLITMVIAMTAAAKSVIGCFFAPALSALVVDVTPPERLPRMQALLGTSGTIAGLLGQAVAGLAFDRLGGSWLLAIDGLSFLVSGLACTLLRAPERIKAPDHQEPPLWRSGLAGLAFVWKHPVLRRIQLTNAVLGLVGIPCYIALPALLRSVGGEGTWLGFTFAAGGLGGLLGALAMQTIPNHRSEQVRIALVVGIACNIPYALMCLVITPWQVVLASGLTGFFCTIGGATGGALIVGRIPHHWQGRFNAGSTVISRMLMPIGMLGGGAIADALGPQMVYGLGGIISIAVSMILILDPRYRQFLRGGR